MELVIKARKNIFCEIELAYLLNVINEILLVESRIDISFHTIITTI